MREGRWRGRGWREGEREREGVRDKDVGRERQGERERDVGMKREGKRERDLGRKREGEKGKRCRNGERR